MAELVEVRLREVGWAEVFLSEIRLNLGDLVIVEQERGIDWGEVISTSTDFVETQKEEYRKVIRKVTKEDLRQIEENKKAARSALKVCEKKVVEHKLPMKLVGTEYSFDRTKVIFYFTADHRIDFRALVRDLAKIFKIRIEMRQIGVRDEAKFFGGLGICGRPLCCATFLKNFSSVSIKLAKEQQLSLNPQKISGICGRLMCCLEFEASLYEELLKKLPKIGEEIGIPQGKGKVIALNPLKQSVIVELEDRQIEYFIKK